MKLRKLLLGGLTTTLVTAPIVTNITTANTLNNVFKMTEETFNYGSNKEVKFEKTSSIDCKFSMVETRAYDGHGDAENFYNGGLPFNKTLSGWNGSRKGYNEPTFDEKTNTLNFSTNGWNNISHLIAQKIKVDITVPANATDWNLNLQINGLINTNGSSHNVGNYTYSARTKHTIQLFDLGEDMNNNPERFDDSFAKDQKTDKYCVAEQKICHDDTVFEHDKFDKSITYTLSNNTDKPITISKYIMVSMLTCGELDIYGIINSTSAFTFNGRIVIPNKFSVVETRAYDGHGDGENYYNGGLPFNKTLSGWNGSRQGYNAPTFDEKTNTIKFDTNGHNNISHLIAQKIKVDFTIPPHIKNLKTYIDVDGLITTFAHGSICGNRVRHTIQLFDLGEDINNNPERFDDSFSSNQSKDKFCVAEQQIYHSRNIAGGDTHNDNFKNTVEQNAFLLSNNTDKPVTFTKYIMISILTCGDKDKYGDIGSTSTFKLNGYVKMFVQNDF